MLLVLGAACASVPAGDRRPAPPGPSEGHEIEPWLPGDPAHSATLDLSGDWECWLDPQAVGLAQGWLDDLAAGRRPAGATGEPLALHVPGPIEATEATRLYDGSFWLARDVELPPQTARARLVLHLGLVNDVCRAWWDGVPVASHEGGYDPLDIRLDTPPGLHRLVLMVLDTGPTPALGRTLRTVPHAKEDWYENFGGVLGPVGLEARTGWIATEMRVQPDAASGRVTVTAALLPPRAGAAPIAGGPGVRCEIARGGEVVARADLQGSGTVSATLQVPTPAPWSPESPALYELRLLVGDELVASRAFGFRSFELRDDDVFLNGRRRVLKGVLWQPHFTGTGGMVPPAAELEAEAARIKAAGFDLVRAHVRPAPPAFLDACDRLGLMVLEEPAIGWVDDAPGLQPRLVREVEQMVRRDRDRTCVVMWGLLNELSGRGFLHADALEAAAVALDPSRPVLRDSGGFFGARWRPPGAAADAPMTDTHLYPPWPLPPAERDKLATLGVGAPGPTFASEFGYGTLLDAAAAWDGFRSRGLRDAEALRFRGYARTADRVRAGGEGLTELAPGGSWVQAAAEEQAAALTDMVDALRSNPALDLLCLTQWRAASSECSSGLLGPWGEERPALAAVREALAPVRVIVQPERPSYERGSTVRAQVVVANDSGAAVTGHAALTWTLEPDGDASSEELPGEIEAPPGVSSRPATMTLPAGLPPFVVIQLQVELRTADGGRLLSAPARVMLTVDSGAAAPSPAVAQILGDPTPPAVWTPADEPEARTFLEARGLLVERPDQAAVALLPHAARLPALPFDDALAVWSMVARGGAAVVLLQDPADQDIGRITGAVQGTRTIAGLPLPVAIAPAAGNFNGRVHVLHDDGTARLLGRGEELLSPVAMVCGAPADSEARLVTLGFLGNRLGSPWITEPFGAGRLVLVGLPLLDRFRGAPDPLRESWLMQALCEALQAAVVDAPARVALWQAAGHALPEPWKPRPAAATAKFTESFSEVDELIAFADRAAPLVGGAEALPEAWREVSRVRAEAVMNLLLGDASGAGDSLRYIHVRLRTDELVRFLHEEEKVLAALSALAAQGPPGWAAAWDGRDAWSLALSSWFAGRQAEAFEHLARAGQLLGVAPGD